MTDESQGVNVDEAVDAPKEKTERKPRVPKDPRKFADRPPLTGDLPANLDKMDKTGLRETIRKNGGLGKDVAAYLKPKEIVAVLQDKFPIEMTPYVGYPADKSNITVNNYDELVKVVGDRKAFYLEVEVPRSKERTAQRNEVLGELATKFPGRSPEARTERIKARLSADAPWVPVTAEATRRAERVFDIDGQAGRKTFYDIAPKAQLKVDGTPKANATVLQMSGQVFDDLIRGDAELLALFEVPENFNVAPPKPPREKKPRAKKGEDATSETLPSAEEPTESVDDAITGGSAPAADLEVPTL